MARCLCIGGLYADLMPLKVAAAFLKATVNGLQESQPAYVKLCAAKAVCSWYGQKKMKKKMRNILKSNVPALFRGLSSFAEGHTSENVLTFALSSIASLMPVSSSTMSKVYVQLNLTEVFYSFTVCQRLHRSSGSQNLLAHRKSAA